MLRQSGKEEALSRTDTSYEGKDQENSSREEWRQYFKEWVYWLAGSLVFFGIYWFRIVRDTGEWKWSAWLMPPLIWAAILIVAPIFKSGKR